MSALGAWAEKRKHHEKYFGGPRRRAKESAARLVCVQDNTARIARGDVLTFVVVRNERSRIPYFLDYYRRMGCGHFLFIDQGSSDGFQDLVRGELDCSVWHANVGLAVEDGTDWLNFLLSRFGDGHWCLTVDASDLLVFPYCENRNLHELIEFLEMENRDHLFCIQLDMYGSGRVGQMWTAEGRSPLESAPFFDALGYTQIDNHSYGETVVQGGVRRRAFFKSNPHQSPALNRTPLVKWKRDYLYLTATRSLAPQRLNRPHAPFHVSPSGCLLSFKLLSTVSDGVDSDSGGADALMASADPIRKAMVLQGGVDTLVNEHSARFESSRQLHDLGLLNFGQWF